MKKTLTAQAILALIASLAMSQGFYGRLLNAIEENPEEGEEWLANMEAQGFTSDLDAILFLEA